MSIKHNNGWVAQARGLFLGGAALVGLAALSACSSDNGGGMASAPAEVAAKAAYVQANANVAGAKTLGGKVHGGDKAVAWSVITLYAAGHSGAGSASLIGAGFSDQNGNVTAVYFCPAGNPQVYAVAQGGNAGGGYNSAIGLSAALGACNSLPSSAVISEATTVAATYALSQFLDASGQKPGASASNAAGLNNAVAVFGNLADISTGLAATALAGGAAGTPPTATVNSLADALAPCVTSSGPSSSACAALFAAATPAGAGAPASTLQASLNIARAPGANAAAVFAASDASGPFQPVLGAAPNDWTLAITFSGGNIRAPQSVTVDSEGAVWIANRTSVSTINGGLGSVVKLSAGGVQSDAFTDANHLLNPSAVAFDSAGTAWVANGGSNTASALTAAGASFGASPYSLGEVSRPALIATDAAGNVWSAASNNLAVLHGNTGYAAQSFALLDTPTEAPFITSLALDNGGNVWLSDNIGDLVMQISGSNPPAQLAGSPYTGGGLVLPSALALDASANVWVTNGPNGVANGVTELLKGASGYTALHLADNDVSSVSTGKDVAVDGSGNVWIANTDFTGNRGLVVLNNAGAAVNGTPYTAGGTISSAPAALAVDRSGNVWMAIGGFANKVVEVVGAAAPVKTPLIGQPQLP